MNRAANNSVAKRAAARFIALPPVTRGSAAVDVLQKVETFKGFRLYNSSPGGPRWICEFCTRIYTAQWAFVFVANKCSVSMWPVYRGLIYLIVARSRAAVVSEILSIIQTESCADEFAFIAAAGNRADVVSEMCARMPHNDHIVRSAIEAAATFKRTALLQSIIEIARPSFNALRPRALQLLVPCEHEQCSYPDCDVLDLREAMCCAAFVGDVAALNILVNAGALRPPLFSNSCHRRLAVDAAAAGGHRDAIQWVQANAQ